MGSIQSVHKSCNNIMFTSDGTPNLKTEPLYKMLSRKLLRPYSCKAAIIQPGFHKTPLTSPDLVKRDSDEHWNKLTPEIRKEYGEDYYQKSKENYCD